MKPTKQHTGLGKWLSYAALIVTLLSACNAPVIDHGKKGMEYVAIGMWDSARWHLRQHLEFNPQDDSVRYELGGVLENLRQSNEAKKEYATLVNDARTACSIRRNAANSCGRIFEYQPQLDSALYFYYRAFHFAQACPIDEKDAGFCYVLISQVHQKAGHLESALAAIDSAAILGSNPIFAAIDRGTILYRMQRYTEAEAAFEKGLALCATDTDSMGHFEGYQGKALAALAQGKNEQACADFRRAILWRHPAPDTTLARICK